jgi:hypothetical protein
LTRGEQAESPFSISNRPYRIVCEAMRFFLFCRSLSDGPTVSEIKILPKDATYMILSIEWRFEPVWVKPHIYDVGKHPDSRTGQQFMIFSHEYTNKRYGFFIRAFVANFLMLD